jgi:hypothetical protein
MKIMSERNQVRGVAERWREQYGNYRDPSKQRITAELAAIDDEVATAEEVKAIIGNDSWAGQKRCNECGERSWEVVQLGEEPDFESATACICEGCLRKALKLIKDNRAGVKP